jgi:transcriptional regulator with PAS, ATPase and Fis domain
MENVLHSLQRVIEIERLYKTNRANRRLQTPNTIYFGDSAAMQEVLNLAQLAAENDTVILIEGETGTGKGLLARWIHEHSIRKDRVCIELNCSGLRGELLQSELFGHAKGAYTSAIKEREGLIELAHGGTLFLDEIGDMGLEVQAQLLKTIEEKTFRRLGENRLRTSDFRLLCASNRNLSEAISSASFRKDLFYRVSAFPIHVPPLRERVEAMEGLALNFLDEFHYPHLTLSPEVIQVLKTYSWPGNVRELKNMMERACLLAKMSAISIEHLPGLKPEKTPGQEEPVYRLKEAERKHIEKILKEFNGDKNKASKALGISLASIYRRLGKKVPGNGKS